jgi:hypothetical protein
VDAKEHNEKKVFYNISKDQSLKISPKNEMARKT